MEYLGQTWGSQSSLESLGTQGSAASERKRISSEKWKQGARKTLLQWVTNALPKSVFCRIDVSRDVRSPIVDTLITILGISYSSGTSAFKFGTSAKVGETGMPS